MIEVTQKDSKGRIQTIWRCTEQQFGEYYWPHQVEEDFSTRHNMVGSKEVHIEWDLWVRVPIFKYVAYNERGKILDVSHLLGIARKYNKGYNRRINWNWRRAGTVHNKRRHRGTYFRHMRTTQERRWAHAWDDEEFAPSVRGKRRAKNLPSLWDDRKRFNTKSWKKVRKNQWKE